MEAARAAAAKAGEWEVAMRGVTGWGEAWGMAVEAAAAEAC